MSNLNNKKINICILEMSSQNKAILEFFFDNSGKSLFEETSLDHASAYIVDYDYPDAKERAEEIHSTYKIPGIIISIKEVQLPDTVWIAKPLTIKALSSANKKISTIISEIAEKEKVLATENKNQAIHQSQEKIFAEEALLPEKDSIQDKLNNSLKNIEVQKTAKKESVHEKQPSIQNNKAINIETHALADFDELPYEGDLQIKDAVKPIVSENSSSTDKEVDELLHQLNASNNDILNNDLIIENSPPRVEESENNNSEAISSLLDFNSIEDDILEKEKSTTHQGTKVAQPDSSTPLEMDKDGFLGIDFSDKNDTKDEQDQASILVDNLDESIQELQSEVELTLDTQEFDNQARKSAIEEASPSIDYSESDYFEAVIDDTTSNLPTDDTILKNEINSVSKETKPESILEQVNEQLNDDLLNIDSFSLSNNAEANEKDNDNDNEANIIDPESFDKNDHLTKSHQDESTSLLNENIANLTDLKAVSTDDLSDSDYYETISHDTAVTELPTDKSYDLESDLSTSSDKTIEDNKAPIEKEVISDDITTATETEASLSAEEELQALLEEIRQEAEGKSSKLIRNNDGKESKTYRHTPTFAEERWALTCGNNDPVSGKKNPYLPNEHMLNTLLKVIDKSKSTEKVMRLKFNGVIIVVIPDSQTIYCDMSIYNGSYAEVCFKPISQENIKIHYLDTSEIRQYRKAITEEPEFSHSFEAFIWTTSLLTSRGRLPHGTDLKRTVAIKYWPDLTRLETFPHIMQISAVFYKHPGSLRDIPTWLGIEQRYIYAFYNGVLSLKLMELDQKQLSLQTHKSSSFKKNKNRGFFSRLLKRINT